MSLIYLYLNQPNDERWIVAVRIVGCFLFLPLQRASALLARETLSCGKRNERAKAHTHIEKRDRGKEGPWHDAGLFLIKVTLATTSSPSLSLSLCMLFFLSLYRLDVSIMIRVVLFPFFSHLTCTFCIIYFTYKRR